MTKRNSRHAQLESYRRPLAQGLPGRDQEFELLRPRLRANPKPGSADGEANGRRHQVVAGDRLDLLAYRYFDDPHQYWRIADANPDIDLQELTEPGRVLNIPERR